jgi:hypothetical protein
VPVAHNLQVLESLSKDLELDQEQKDVGMAVDMDFARKATVFIGNGVSPFLFILDDCEIATDPTCFPVVYVYE